MRFNSMIDHPNFKFILKNKKVMNMGAPFVLINSTKYSPYAGLLGYHNRYQVFEDAEYYSANVFLRTTAGNIEIFEKDFQ